jgi:hypothetical protein
MSIVRYAEEFYYTRLLISESYYKIGKNGIQYSPGLFSKKKGVYIVIIDKFILRKTGKVAKMKAGGGKPLTFREARPRIQIGYEKKRKLEKNNRLRLQNDETSSIIKLCFGDFASRNKMRCEV